ncbi:MAG: SPOR domain-containing protein [Usitatibacter sp.]
MASPASPEASEIRRRGRRRLIGAIAIAILLVVFVPMILDSEPNAPRNSPALEIPAKDKAAPLPPPAPAAKPATAVAPAQPPEPQPSPGVVPKPAPDVASVPAAPAAAKASANSPAQAKPAAPPLEGFAVQVGAFKDEEKLKQAREKLAAAGIRHYIERRDTQSGELTRLRAGPFPTREAAEKALAAVKSASLDGQVVPLP